MKKIKVIYIVGSGRSGSTVLDTVLGDNADVESVGELVNAPKAFSNQDEYCACGERAGECDFWNAVEKKWYQLSKFKDINELVALQSKYERFRNLPYLFFLRIWKTNKYRMYLDGTQSMYQAIASVSGKQIIVDSSKSPVRAFALSKMPFIELYALHLIRDGRGVVWSLIKPFKKNPKSGVQKDLKSRPVWRTALFWLVINFLSEMIVGRALRSKYIQIRYEDFVENTNEIMKEIGDFVGVNYEATSNKIREQKSVTVGHTVAGNRARMAGIIKLKADYQWKQMLSKRDAKIYWAIAGLLAKRYGYKKVFLE